MNISSGFMTHCPTSWTFRVLNVSPVPGDTQKENMDDDLQDEHLSNQENAPPNPLPMAAENGPVPPDGDEWDSTDINRNKLRISLGKVTRLLAITFE